MTDYNNKIRAVVLAALMVLSVFAGTVAFTGTAAAASVGGATSLTPTTVSNGTTNTHSVTLELTDVNTSDGTNTAIAAEFPAALDISGAGIANVNVVEGNVTGTTNVSTSGQTLFVDLVESGGVDSDTVEVEFDVTGVSAVAVGSGDITVDVTDANGDITDATLASVTVEDDPDVVMGDPATVYLGDEDLDLTNVAGVPSSGSFTFTGVAGSADGSTGNVGDVQNADITEANDFTTGGYSTDGADDIELSVAEPSVTDLEIQTDSGADITDGSFSGSDTLEVFVDWNFDDFEAVEISVEDEAGLDVTNQLEGGDGVFVTTSGNSITLENVDELDNEEYTLTAEGEGDLDGASRSATFTVREEDQSITLDQSTVTQGDDAVATVTGSPGAYGLLRVDSGDVDNLPSGTDSDSKAAAEEVFADTGDVESLNGSAEVGANETFVGAVVDLDDEGEAQVRVNTAFLDTTTVDVEFVELDSADTSAGNVADGFDADDDASAELTIEERSINITSAPSVVRIGEDFDIDGTASESDTVKAYARIDEDWVPLREDSDTSDAAIDDAVDDDGSFSITVDSGSIISLPDSYRIGVVADPVNQTNDDGDVIEDNIDSFGQGNSIDSADFSDFDTTSTVSVRTVEGDLTAELSSSEIASTGDDNVDLTGTALGQGDSVRVYIVGPRGDFLDEDGNTLANGDAVFEADIEEEEFDEEISGFDQRGTYTFIIVGQGRDGNYGFEPDANGGGLIEQDLTPQQAVEIINDEYTGAGVDDQIVELTLQAQNPELTIDDFTTDGQVAQGEVTISGTSNREDETTVFIEVLGQDENVIASTEAEVNGSSNEWETTIDMSDVETGTYTLRADDDEASASLEFELVESVSTPTETPAPDTETPEPDTATPEPDTATPEPDTATPAPETETTTSTSTPGFGAIVALVALIAAALLAIRRD